MPNQHYFVIDMTKIGLSNKDEVSDKKILEKGLSHTQVISSEYTSVLTEQSSEFSGSDKIRLLLKWLYCQISTNHTKRRTGSMFCYPNLRAWRVCGVLLRIYISIYISHYVVVLSFQVYLPLDNPAGNITGTVRRKPRAKM